ncbi:putative methylmalonyl-CoA epimerase [Candidatus Nitrosarchaeum limnium BG20]|uniref:Putative methylmalonyl-CoA epimerase n=1 Tax=Candidatus Nitrosarchaeum limnium BG20 TaxID=859192 RepID=S2E1Q0_9ARCH|nr:putative methylmalonyl-CoA epimerase [Candidatus Nitrosarchaeum limnium BG20]
MLKLHHIGIVVSKISNSFPELTKYIKFEKTTIPIFITSQKVNVCFLKIGEFNLELIEPVGEDSPVATFANKGGGFHHLCFEVKNIREKLDEFVKNGARIIVEPVIGFEGRLTAFVLLNMKDTKINLVELAEEEPVKS